MISRYSLRRRSSLRRITVTSVDPTCNACRVLLHRIRFSFSGKLLPLARRKRFSSLVSNYSIGCARFFYRSRMPWYLRECLWIAIYLVREHRLLRSTLTIRSLDVSKGFSHSSWWWWWESSREIRHLFLRWILAELMWVSIASVRCQSHYSSTLALCDTSPLIREASIARVSFQTGVCSSFSSSKTIY